MQLLLVLLLGFCMNLQQYRVGFALGRQGIGFQQTRLLGIGAIGTFTAFFTAYLGYWLSSIEQWNFTYIGIILLSGYGIARMLFYNRRNSFINMGYSNIKYSDMNMNALPIILLPLIRHYVLACFFAGMMGVNPLSLAFIVGSGCILALGWGNRNGHDSGKTFHYKAAGLLEGIIFIFCGLCGLFL